MKLSIALAVLATVASTYASPMPDAQDNTQLDPQPPTTADEFVQNNLAYCQALFTPQEGTWGKIKSTVKTLYRKVNSPNKYQQKVLDMCSDIIAIAANPAPIQANALYGAASGAGNFADQGYGGDLGASLPWVDPNIAGLNTDESASPYTFQNNVAGANTAFDGNSPYPQGDNTASTLLARAAMA